MFKKVLSIEDDLSIQQLIELSLAECQVTAAYTLAEAKNLLSQNQFDALILDIELPDGDGLQFYSKLIQNDIFLKIPTIFLTGHTDIETKLLAFSAGADDFLSKPFNPLELKARVLSKIQKNELFHEQNKSYKIGDLLIDLDRQKVFLLQNKKEIDLCLTSYEIKILLLLTKRPEVVYSREQILQNVWSNTHISDRTIDSHIAHLRSKIKDSCVQIETVKSLGYKALLKK